MNADSIVIRGVQASYRPGTSISGSVEWSTTKAIDALVIKLLWMTSGASPCQIGVVDSFKIGQPNSYGTSGFEFHIPEGPWSFEGRLLGLAWAVEAVALPSKQHVQVIFEMMPAHHSSNLYRTEAES